LKKHLRMTNLKRFYILESKQNSDVLSHRSISQA